MKDKDEAVTITINRDDIINNLDDMLINPDRKEEKESFIMRALADHFNQPPTLCQILDGHESRWEAAANYIKEMEKEMEQDIE
jgi:hypothetical protein